MCSQISYLVNLIFVVIAFIMSSTSVKTTTLGITLITNIPFVDTNAFHEYFTTHFPKKVKEYPDLNSR